MSSVLRNCLFLSIAACSAWAQNSPQVITPSGVVLQELPSSGASTRSLRANARDKEIQTVVVKLSTPPVAVMRALAPRKQLAATSEQAIVKNIQIEQAAMLPAIRSTGATVLATFQHAMNGIKVRGTADQIAALSSLPGVVAVKKVGVYQINNAASVPYIGAPLAWQGPPGLHGEHVKIAIIDTGIDYTHANFGGPGTVSAFQTAQATSTLAADPTLFGPGAPKVKGGIDLVGDAYNANTPGSIPVPDPNPLDCNGHGSHTAGTATGLGVLAGGATYTGPYDSSTPNQNFIIGPGVAPLADLYAVRVFGCSGSTDVVVEALDWALANGMQVVSMSLGSNGGNEDTADAEASENLVNAGIVVVAASGNASAIPYITSSPATGEKVISVAAMDSHVSYPGAVLALTPSGSITAQDSNGAPLPSGQLPIVVLRNPNGTISLGCNASEYTPAVQGALVVTLRGVCARVLRAQLGQQAGAAAVAMINTSAGYPVFEGPIPGVTIPFLGVLSADRTLLAASTAATMTSSTISNPTGGQFASFSSAGPRIGDGHLKPEITAPGVSVFSTLSGSGNQGLFESGTSMATPHVAGSAALTIQAHPTWTAAEISNAVVNTADSSKLVGYNATQGGNGLVQPFPATRTLVTARGSDGSSTLNFGVAEFSVNYSGSSTLTLQNHGDGASFTVSIVPGAGSPHTATPSRTSIFVPVNGTATLDLLLKVPAATNGDSTAFRQVEGQVVLTPTHGNNGVKLSVPYYLVSRARSEVKAQLLGSVVQNGSGTVKLKNTSMLINGTADLYAWGLAGNGQNPDPIALRAVGVQSFSSPSGQILGFAVNTAGRISNADFNETDILVDIDGDGNPDYAVAIADLGQLQGQATSGQAATEIVNLKTGGRKLEYIADTRTDASTSIGYVRASDLGITPANPRFSYTAQIFDNSFGKSDAITTPAKFNAFSSSISTAGFAALPPGSAAQVPVTYNVVESGITPALGIMVVSSENTTAAGQQAILLPVH